MPTKQLPAKASIDHLRYQARDLITAHAATDPQAAQRIREFHPRLHRATDSVIFGSPLLLNDAQLVIAREYGFLNWTKLRKHLEERSSSISCNLPRHERIQDPAFRQAVDLLDAGDEQGLRSYLHQHPKLVAQRINFEGENYFRNPTLLEFVAENPIRHGCLPGNIVLIAKLILDAGSRNDGPAMNETLGLVSSGCVARQCGVQLPLIDLLVKSGADANSAMLPALVHGEFAAAQRLISQGANINLWVAAATGQTEVVRRLLSTSSADERHLALALAAQFGQVESVRLLLDAGENPNRYNPLGAHSHSTPLHQAALAGHVEVVRLLVERGTRLDLKDTLFQGTPADWAQHNGRSDVEHYLRQRQAEGR